MLWLQTLDGRVLDNLVISVSRAQRSRTFIALFASETYVELSNLAQILYRTKIGSACYILHNELISMPTRGTAQ